MSHIKIFLLGLLLMGAVYYPLASAQGTLFPTFITLLDTPNSYAGQAGKFAAVNPDENGLTFLDANGGGGVATSCDENTSCVLTGTIDTNQNYHFGSTGTFDTNATFLDYLVIQNGCIDFGGGTQICVQGSGIRFYGAGNITFEDAPFWGTNGKPIGQIVSNTGYRYTGAIDTAGYTIPANRYAYTVTSTQSGEYFRSSPYNAIELHINADPLFKAIFDSSGGTSASLRPFAEGGTPNTFFGGDYFIESNETHDLNIPYHNYGDETSANWQRGGSFQDDLNVEGKIVGSISGWVAAAGTTCDTICDAADNIWKNANYSCVGAFDFSASSSTCSSSTSTRNCVCGVTG